MTVCLTCQFQRGADGFVCERDENGQQEDGSASIDGASLSPLYCGESFSRFYPQEIAPQKELYPMLSWFRKKDSAPPPTLAEALAALEQQGISKRDDVTLDDIRSSMAGKPGTGVDYGDLLCTLGSEVDREEDYHPMSDDIWHFDTECIYEDEDYARIAKRLQSLSKGVLQISNISSRLEPNQSKAWLEFDFKGKRIHWDLKLQDDWVDESIFTRFVQLFASTPSEARFTYGDLEGQDCLIGFATFDQHRALSKLTGVKFEWLK